MSAYSIERRELNIITAKHNQVKVHGDACKALFDKFMDSQDPDRDKDLMERFREEMQMFREATRSRDRQVRIIEKIRDKQMVED